MCMRFGMKALFDNKGEGPERWEVREELNRGIPEEIKIRGLGSGF